jgi:hypothetical protein
MKRLSQRFVLAVVAFLSAAAWKGLGLVSALECLLVFAVVYAITGAVLDGRDRLERRRMNSSRSSRSRNSDAAHRGSEQPVSLRESYELSRRPSPYPGQGLFDGGDEGWARAADRSW